MRSFSTRRLRGTDEGRRPGGRIEPVDGSAGRHRLSSVVQIFTTSYVPSAGVVAREADLVTTQRASGSGVIVDPEGYIVTNVTS